MEKLSLVTFWLQMVSRRNGERAKYSSRRGGLLRGFVVKKFHELTYDVGSCMILLVAPDGEVYFRMNRRHPHTYLNTARWLAFGGLCGGRATCYSAFWGQHGDSHRQPRLVPGSVPQLKDRFSD